MLTHDEIIWGYRYVLGRDPRPAEVSFLTGQTIVPAGLRTMLLGSEEFAAREKVIGYTSKWVITEVFEGRVQMWIDLADKYVVRLVAVQAITDPGMESERRSRVLRGAATPVAQRNLYFSEVLLDPSNPLSPTTFFITEEGQTPAVFTMDQQPNIVVHSGTVEDWTIENRTQEDHIFHIHQMNHS